MPVEIVVNMADARISNRDEVTLATYSLGSCIGLAMYDGVARVGGLLHYQLPCSTLNPDNARRNPFMFADTGLERLLALMTSAGASIRRLQIKLAGAAQMFAATSELFSVGRRNHTSVRKLIWQHGLFIAAEDIGGSDPRHMFLDIADGAVRIRKQGQSTKL